MARGWMALSTLGLCLLGGCTRAGFLVPGDLAPPDGAADGLLLDATADGPRDLDRLDQQVEAHDSAGDQPRDTAPVILLEDDFAGPYIAPQWTLWMRQFAIEAGTLVPLLTPRPGFNYGHSGNGRGAQAATHVGDTGWTDYRLEFDMEVTRGEIGCTSPSGFSFRLAKAVEGWNSDGRTGYGFSFVGEDCGGMLAGEWVLGFARDYYIPGTGWSDTYAGSKYELATGSSPAIHTGPNHIVVEVRGTVIAIWFNGELIVTHDTSSDADAVGHGGFCINWGWESDGWADNVKVTAL